MPAKEGVIKLNKAPFTIRVKLPAPRTVQLNALDTDDNFKRVKAGMPSDFTKEQLKETSPDELQLPHCFIPGTGSAEVGRGTGRPGSDDDANYEWLFVSRDAHHHLYFEDAKHHRWSKATVTSGAAVFERNVSRLSVESGDEELEMPVPKFAKDRLFLLFYVESHDKKTLDEDELKKLALEFSEPK